jgi:Leucine-rich repeat (LRR) protein
MKQFYSLFIIPFILAAAEQGDRLSGEASSFTDIVELSDITTLYTDSYDLRVLEIFKKINEADELRFINGQLGILRIPRLANPFVKLHTLSLEDCGITELPDHVFLGFAALTYITLAKNKIKTLTPATFEGLPDIAHLDLSCNKLMIKTFALETFNACPSLRHLSLNYNPWTEKKRDRFLIKRKIIESLQKGKDLVVTAEINHDD